MRESLETQLSEYEKIMDDAHTEAERLRSLGVNEDDEAIRSLRQTWWDAYNTHAELLKTMGETIVNVFSGALDKVQGAYDTLTGAAKEFSESGFITVDTFQSILSLGVEYLKYLYDENGQIKLNEESVRNLVAAKTRDLAITQALSLIDTIKLHLDDAEALRKLTEATIDASSSTWDLVYAQLAALNLDSKLYTAFLDQVNAIRSMGESAVSSIGAVSGEVSKYYSELGDYLDDVLKSTMELVKWEAEQKVEALERQVDEYNKIIDAKKESLALTKSEASYEKSVAEKVKEVAKLRARLTALELDDSREAGLERGKLLEELADLQGTLADEQADHAYDVQVETLDDMQKAFAEQKEAEMDVVRDTVSSTEKVYQQAIWRLEHEWEATMVKVIHWNQEAGSSLDSELRTAWENASDAVQKYNGYLAAVEETQRRIKAETQALYEQGNTISPSVTDSGASSTKETTPDLMTVGRSIVQQMNANSKSGQSIYAKTGRWDDDAITALNEKNKHLAQELADALGLRYNTDIKFDAGSGEWSIFGKELYKYFGIYHTGGVVGNANNNDREQFALLERGEWVLADKQKETVGKLIDLSGFILEKSAKISELMGGIVPQDLTAASKLPVSYTTALQARETQSAPQINISAPLTLSGATDKSVLDVVKRYPRLIAEQVSRALNAPGVG
jgi:hypothetical protein